MTTLVLSLSDVEIVIREDRQFQDEPHEHTDHYQMLIPLAGNIDCRINRETRNITVGSISIKNPGDLHQHTVETYAKSAIITWKRNEYIQWLNVPDGHMKAREFPSFHPIDFKKFIHLIRKWISDYASSFDPETAQAVQDEIWEFVTTFVRSPEFRPVPCPLTDPYLQKALEYLHHHYHEKVSIDMLCSIAQQSKFHFIRSFRQWTGFSPHQYLLHLRVHHAKQLLKQKHKSIQEISEQLGFSCSSHFYRVFLKTVGVSPGVYRSQHT